MLAKVFQKRLMSSTSAAARFPEGTVAGHFKASMGQKSHLDAVRFDNQNINWTLKELDVSLFDLKAILRVDSDRPI